MGQVAFLISEVFVRGENISGGVEGSGLNIDSLLLPRNFLGWCQTCLICLTLVMESISIWARLFETIKVTQLSQV